MAAADDDLDKAQLDSYEYTGEETTLTETLKAFILTNNNKARPTTSEELLFQNGETKGMVILKYFPGNGRATNYPYIQDKKVLIITHVFIYPRGGGHVNRSCGELLADEELADALDVVVIEAVETQEYADSLVMRGWTKLGSHDNYYKERPNGGKTRRRKRRRSKSRRRRSAILFA